MTTLHFIFAEQCGKINDVVEMSSPLPLDQQLTRLSGNRYFLQSSADVLIIKNAKTGQLIDVFAWNV